MADKTLIDNLWESDAASTLTNQAAREIEKLEADLQQAINDRNEAWCQLEEAGIEIRQPSQCESVMVNKDEQCISGVSTKTVLSGPGILVREMGLESETSESRETDKDQPCKSRR